MAESTRKASKAVENIESTENSNKGEKSAVNNLLKESHESSDEKMNGPSMKKRRTTELATTEVTGGGSSATRPRRGAAKTAATRIQECAERLNLSSASIELNADMEAVYNDANAFVDLPKRKTPTKNRENNSKSTTPKKKAPARKTVAASSSSKTSAKKRNKVDESFAASTASGNDSDDFVSDVEAKIAGSSKSPAKVQSDEEYRGDDDRSVREENEVSGIDVDDNDDDGAGSDWSDDEQTELTMDKPEVREMAEKLIKNVDVINARQKAAKISEDQMMGVLERHLENQAVRAKNIEDKINDARADLEKVRSFRAKLLGSANKPKKKVGDAVRDDDGGTEKAVHDDDGGAEKAAQEQEEVIDMVNQLEKSILEGPDADAKMKAYKDRLNHLWDEFDRRYQERYRKTENSMNAMEGLAISTIGETQRRFQYWIAFLATQPDLGLGDFNRDTIGGFFNFLSGQKCRTGRADRIGKELEPGTVLGIFTATFFMMKFLDYINYDAKFDDYSSKQQRKVHFDKIAADRAPEPIIREELYPIDVVVAICKTKFKKQSDHQSATYWLLKASTLMRKSSILKLNNCKSPGILLKDVGFSYETPTKGPRKGQRVLTLKLRIMFEKQVKASKKQKKEGRKEPNYPGKIIKLGDLDNNVSVVKYIFLQCLYLDAFKNDCGTMFRTGDFTMKEERMESTLFRVPDAYGNLTSSPMVDDKTAMEEFAKTMCLPLYLIAGHCYRGGGATIMANANMEALVGGSATLSNRRLFAMTGVWEGTGWGHYIKKVTKDRLDANEVLFGGKTIEEALRDFIDERICAYAPDERQYYKPNHPIVQAAAERLTTVKKAKEELDEKEKELETKWADFGLPGGWNSGRNKTTDGYKNRVKELTPQQRTELINAQKERKQSDDSWKSKLFAARKNMASYANELVLRGNQGRKTNRCEEPKTVKLLDLEKAAAKIEEYMKNTLPYFYGPFEKPSPENVLRCWVKTCGQSFGQDVVTFIEHLHTHGIVLYSGTRDEKSRKLAENEKDRKLVCWLHEDKEYDSIRFLRRHFQQHHRKVPTIECQRCHQQFTGCNTSARLYHNRKCAGRSVNVIAPFVDYGSFTRIAELHENTSEVILADAKDQELHGAASFFANKKCEYCVDLRAKMETNICVAKLKTVDDILAGAVRIAKRYRSVVEAGTSHPLVLSASQEENCDAPETWAAVELCATFFPTVDVSAMKMPDFKRLFTAKCRCIAERFDEWSSGLKVVDHEQMGVVDENNAATFDEQNSPRNGNKINLEPKKDATEKRSPAGASKPKPNLFGKSNGHHDDEAERLADIVEREILDTTAINVKWDDIAGLGRVKKIIQEIVVWPMLRPELFTGLRALPRGLLLFGPPGTGKTTLGRCIASQAKATFYCISASSLTSKWVGENEKLVRALFDSARAHQPAVVFVDEIDALLSNRVEGEHDSTRRLKTQFFTELDGAKTFSEERILVVGATNRPGDLDDAARRRLTKRLYVPLPDLAGRAETLNNSLKLESHSLKEEEIQAIAERTDGFSCDDVNKMCQVAALGPLRKVVDITSVTSEELPPISNEDFENALRVVRPSVAPEQLAQYEEFDRRFGSAGGFE